MNMRARTAVLREIARQNLDPKEVYVPGKNGSLVPKKPSKTENVEDKKENLEEKIEQIKEEQSLEIEPSAVEPTEQKKKTPPKKKKATTE